MTMGRILGVLLLAIGGMAAIIYAMGLIDPVGAQLADDNDPFGAPPHWWYGAMGLFVSLAVAGIGAWLAQSSRWASRRHPGGERSS